jgi:hypothetical protein
MRFILFAELQVDVFSVLLLYQMSADVHALYCGPAGRNEEVRRFELVFLFSARYYYPFLETILHLEAQNRGASPSAMIWVDWQEGSC